MSTILISPAAGAATRMGGINKELLPLGILANTRINKLPAPVVSWTIRTALLAGVDKAIFVTSASKLPALKATLSSLGLPIPIDFVQQTSPNGLSEAILCAEDNIGSEDIALLLMPDTIVSPAELVTHSVESVRHGKRMSVTLHTSARPERFGVARFDDNDELAGFIDKPEIPPSNWFWTSAAFRPVFFEYVRELIETENDYTLTTALDRAVKDGVVVSHRCDDGSYFDVGTYDGYLDALNFHGNSVIELPVPQYDIE